MTTKQRMNRPDDIVIEKGAGMTMEEASLDWEWDTVQEESATRVVFDTIGDVFVGKYLGTEHITPDKKTEEVEEFDLFLFEGTDGERYAINHSYSLVKGMEKVAINQWTRIAYTKDLPTRRGLNPMKDFRVDVRRA